MRRVYLDLDGVLADFDGTYERLFGHHPDDASTSSLMWQNIWAADKFFLNLQPFFGHGIFYNQAANLADQLCPILTACPRSRFGEVAVQKREWVRRNLPDDTTMIPTPESKSKPFYMHAPGDILIDDWSKNCEAWELAGGAAIQHKGNYAETLSQLEEALHAAV
jgi:hypothetical protein